MAVYYKFLRPSEEYFGNKQRASFDQMFIPHLNDPTEKYCYAEIEEEMFSSFLEDFPASGEILIDRKEFPDSNEDITSGRNMKFTDVQPKRGWI